MILVIKQFDWHASYKSPAIAEKIKLGWTFLAIAGEQLILRKTCKQPKLNNDRRRWRLTLDYDVSTGTDHGMFL